MKKLIYLLTLTLLLTACGTSDVPVSRNNESPSEPLPPAESEMKEGNFVYRLFSEKDVYDEFGETAIFAELEYVGELDSIDIYHSASAFHFPIEERTRGIEIDYAMNEPLIMTTLQKGEPLRQNYAFAGGYSDSNTTEYVNLIKTIIDKGFPEGEYIIHGFAEFMTEEPPVAEEKNNHQLKAEIGFNVRKGVNE